HRAAAGAEASTSTSRLGPPGQQSTRVSAQDWFSAIRTAVRQRFPENRLEGVVLADRLAQLVRVGGHQQAPDPVAPRRPVAPLVVVSDQVRVPPAEVDRLEGVFFTGLQTALSLPRARVPGHVAPT